MNIHTFIEEEIDKATKEICSVTVAPSPKSKVRRILHNSHMRMLEKIRGEIKNISDSQEYQTDGEYVKCEDLVDDILSMLEDKK